MAEFDICRKAVKANASMNANVLIVSERCMAFPILDKEANVEVPKSCILSFGQCLR